MINEMTIDPNRMWKERVDYLNKIHSNLSTLERQAEEIKGIKNRSRGRLLIQQLVDILEELDVLMDHRGR